MSIYEFYVTYILTNKAIFVSTSMAPLRAIIIEEALHIYYRLDTDKPSVEIPYNQPITSLTIYGIKLFLLTDPVYVSASLLTGVISIPVPEPDELPF